ncbi:unnamed protein product [Miscanthus lutarioriparius]|uniref:Non-haem dioxygenase N-terminal domain-containing protein n=1 Tax=Miscanthus lutarioriparius TaxID=422564 RepID=A0A811NAG4_9POAL|nr:unnamed protein product [Miscanthus lutarioriparius]
MAAGSRLDLASPDPRAAAKSIRQVPSSIRAPLLFIRVRGVRVLLRDQPREFADSRKFFEQTMEEKMALGKNSRYRGYTWPYSEKVDDSPESRGQDRSSHE